MSEVPLQLSLSAHVLSEAAQNMLGAKRQVPEAESQVLPCAQSASLAQEVPLPPEPVVQTPRALQNPVWVTSPAQKSPVWQPPPTAT